MQYKRKDGVDEDGDDDDDYNESINSKPHSRYDTTFGRRA
jgi:hypothetical protein